MEAHYTSSLNKENDNLAILYECCEGVNELIGVKHSVLHRLNT